MIEMIVMAAIIAITYMIERLMKKIVTNKTCGQIERQIRIFESQTVRILA